MICQARVPGNDHYDMHGAENFADGDISIGAAKPVYSYNQIADYLTEGFWSDFGATARQFDVQSGQTLTYNLDGLTTQGAEATRKALDAWTAVSGLQFRASTVSSAQIVFDDNDSGAYAYSFVSSGHILQSYVNVNASWANYGGYYHQAYMHEIGHALGLGHTGNYNGSADYETDAGYANDSWQTSVMSYFSQSENTWNDATTMYLATLQLGDIAAIHKLYGTPVNVQTGHTVYGDGESTGGRFGMNLAGTHAVAIVDSGGTDLIDLGSRASDQYLSLVAETYSNINGRVGNLSIGRDTVIENVITGTGNDTIIGNAANNRIESGAGHDTLFGGAGNDILITDSGAAHSDYNTASSQIVRLYQATLARSPDDRGHADWTQKVMAGTSLLSIVSGFTGSAEFQDKYGATSNEDFVTLLYNNVLDRDPDPGGLDDWVGGLNGGMSRENVVLGFSESAEFKLKSAPKALDFSFAEKQADWSDEVVRLYQAALDRLPDVDGFRNWTHALANGSEFANVVSGFVNSAEFQQVYGALDNTEFVTLLYNNVLDRLPDAVGLADWVGWLDSGSISRENVVRGFSESAEFQVKMAPEIEDWMQSLGTDDYLDGGAGDDVLLGGLLADVFKFAFENGGDDTVVGFEAWDTIVLEGFGFADGAMAANAFVHDGADAVLAHGNGEIRLTDVFASSLTANEFVLV